MKQYYCFDCGIPVIDRLNRDSVFLCPTCSCLNQESIDNGVSIKTPKLTEKPRTPRWNFPKEKIYVVKHSVPAYKWFTFPNIMPQATPYVPLQYYTAPYDITVNYPIANNTYTNPYYYTTTFNAN